MKKLKASSMRKTVIQINVHGRKSSNQLISFPCGTIEYSAHGLSCIFCSQKKQNPVKVLFRFKISSLRNFPSNCPLTLGQPDQWVKIVIAAFKKATEGSEVPIPKCSSRRRLEVCKHMWRKVPSRGVKLLKGGNDVSCMLL
jgi:hypothetical protein